MDVEFMEQFYSKMYEEPEKEAVRENREYASVRHRREQVEDRFWKMTETMPREVQNAFSDFMVALNEEQQVLLKAMYMLGAKDRERMLR